MPIIVFNLLIEGNIARAVRGERIGTLVSTPHWAEGSGQGTGQEGGTQP
jgi:uridylate kinase